MLIGYMRVSKTDGSQTIDLQRDALRKVGVKAKSIYQDHASGKKDDRPDLTACLKALRGPRSRFVRGPACAFEQKVTVLEVEKRTVEEMCEFLNVSKATSKKRLRKLW